MSLHTTPHLNAARRRARKRTLARRDGARCSYCWTPLPDLRAATLDHVVPISLFFTWRPENLVLACRSCNDRKADRLPLCVALLLCAQSAADLRDGQRHGRDGSRHGERDGRDGQRDGARSGEVEEVDAGVDTVAVHPTSTRASTSPLVVDWSGLARLARAAQSVADVHPVSTQSGSDWETVGQQSGARVGRLRALDGSTHRSRSDQPVRAVRTPVRTHPHAIRTPAHTEPHGTHTANRAQPRANAIQPRACRAEPRANRAHVTRLCDAPRTRPCDGRPHAGVVSV